MRGILILCGALALASCHSEADNGPKAGDPGIYTRMMPDGAANTTVIDANGRFRSVVGKSINQGTVRTEGTQTCFRGDEDAAQELCWENGPIRPGGTFETTNSDGETFTITYSAESSLETPPIETNERSAD